MTTKHGEQCVQVRGQACPHCGSSAFESEVDDWDEPEMVELNSCEKCGKNWRVGYQIAFVWVEAD